MVVRSHRPCGFDGQHHRCLTGYLVRANFRGYGRFYSAKVLSCHSGRFSILYADGDRETDVLVSRLASCRPRGMCSAGVGHRPCHAGYGVDYTDSNGSTTLTRIAATIISCSDSGFQPVYTIRTSRSPRHFQVYVNHLQNCLPPVTNSGCHDRMGSSHCATLRRSYHCGDTLMRHGCIRSCGGCHNSRRLISTK